LKRDRTVVILVGGKSNRMGFDKANLAIMHETLLEFNIRRYAEYFPNIILSYAEPAPYNFPCVTSVYDEYLGKGPMAGLHSALKNTNSEHVFLTAVDMPFSSPKLAAWLYDGICDAPARVLKYRNFLEPLFGVYSRNTLGKIKTRLEKDENSIYKFIESIDARIVDEQEWRAVYPCPPENLFFNINTPDDYATALSAISHLGLKLYS
jgi:molybdopterin-guanine dinucleotide biosynthesis protein A